MGVHVVLVESGGCHSPVYYPAAPYCSATSVSRPSFSLPWIPHCITIWWLAVDSGELISPSSGLISLWCSLWCYVMCEYQMVQGHVQSSTWYLLTWFRAFDVLSQTCSNPFTLSCRCIRPPIESHLTPCRVLLPSCSLVSTQRQYYNQHNKYRPLITK